MTFSIGQWRTLSALSLVCVLGATSAALAQSASAGSESAGATTGLGTSHRFKTAAAATAHCPGDTIVWTSSSKKSYHLSSSTYYGKTKHGFYACKAEADGAGFHPSNN